MTEIKLTKRYPQSRTEDIVDAYMRGWNDALDAVQNGKFIINDDRKAEPSNSEKPNNCEHITEDGVTCAKYPACDDCLDNPLNKVKGSERLLKGKVEPTISKMEQVDKDINVRSKDEPQNYCDDCLYTDTCDSKEFFYACTSKATISKMEQVETMSCQECKHFHENAVMYLDQCDFCFKDCKYEPQTENLFTDKYGDVWEWRGDAWYCISGDEPQTETEIAKAIVHKMIDDAVIAEDAYPDLRQKMHDAVDEYEPLTDTDLKEVCREEDDEFTDRLIEEQLANKLLTDCAWK